MRLFAPQGTESTLAGKSSACDGCPNQSVCASDLPKPPDPDLPIIRERMKAVKKKILVLSGKGGVGKSTFSSGLGWALSADDDVQVSRLVWREKWRQLGRAVELVRAHHLPIADGPSAQLMY